MTREEACEHFEIQEEGPTNPETINKMLRSIKLESQDRSRSIIFFDEVPLTKEDWTILENNNKNLNIILAFQPLVQNSEKNTSDVQLERLLPKNANNIELNTVFRSTEGIFRALKNIRGIGKIRLIEQKQTPVHNSFLQLLRNDSTSKDVFTMEYKTYDLVKLKSWICIELMKMGCNKEETIILHTDKETEIDAEKVFRRDDWELANWRDFIGSEKEIVIAFFHGSEDKDPNWQLFTISSRAKLKVK